MQKLIVMTCVSLTDPTKETYFEYYLASEEQVSNKIKEIKQKIIDDNTEQYKESSDDQCPYIEGYLGEYGKKGKDVEKYIGGSLVPHFNDEIFFIDTHTTYDFAYMVSVVDLAQDNKFILYEH